MIQLPDAPEGANRAHVDNIAGIRSAEDRDTCVRCIYVNADSVAFTASQARGSANALLNAASELDGLGLG